MICHVILNILYSLSPSLPLGMSVIPTLISQWLIVPSTRTAPAAPRSSRGAVPGPRSMVRALYRAGAAGGLKGPGRSKMGFS